MIKVLLVGLSDTYQGLAAQNYAASVAAAFDARLSGVSFIHDLVIPGSIFDQAAAAYSTQFRRESEAAAQRAIAAFEKKCRQDGLAYDSTTLDGAMVGVSDRLARKARSFDLCVLPQATPDGDGDETLLIEAALFRSGRPVLVVPYIHVAPFKLDRVIVAWDGSAGAARAVGDSLPLLSRSKSVEIVTVTPDTKPDGLPAADLAHHLARHGLKVELRTLTVEQISIANCILSHAADHSADLIVMGGYGHSRLREFVLGGMTREMLQSMTVPTFMSH
jgi:nucleotide-binding universal stress UspA family protein